jgi:hypothetical protein
MQIKAILEALYSKRDRNGNCYWAFRYTDSESGKQVCGTVSGGESNVRSLAYGMGFQSGEFYFTVSESPIREFNRLTKSWKHAGCTQEQLAQYVRDYLFSSPEHNT